MINISKDKKYYIGFLIVITFGIFLIIHILNGANEEIEILQLELEGLEIKREELESEKSDLLIQKFNLEGLIQEKEAKNLELEVKIQDELSQNELLRQEMTELESKNEQLRTIRAKLTAYSPLDNRDGQQSQGNPSRTSTGRKVGRGVVAVDPSKIPYGTKLEIPNYGVVVAGDTGGALRNDNKNIRIDVYKDTYSQAMQFGMKDMNVKILEWGD